MPEYRAYLVDRQGHIKKAEIVSGEDDAAALENAKQYVDGHDVEVWDLDRRVGILKRHE
jgi:hypothetical protein